MRLAAFNVENLFDRAKVFNDDAPDGAHQGVLDAHADKYKFVAEQTANFQRAEGLSVTESLLAGMSTPPTPVNEARARARRRRRFGHPDLPISA